MSCSAILEARDLEVPNRRAFQTIGVQSQIDFMIDTKSFFKPCAAERPVRTGAREFRVPRGSTRVLIAPFDCGHDLCKHPVPHDHVALTILVAAKNSTSSYRGRFSQ
jgi:hypothetical protein